MGRVHMNTKPPAVWQPYLVRRKPTVDEVVAAAAAHGIFGEGRAWVEQCGIGPDGWQLDHAFPESLGGPSHVFNAHLMPANVNARFGNRWDDDKRAYIGSDQERLSIALMKWMRENVEWEAFSESDLWAAHERGRA